MAILFCSPKLADNLEEQVYFYRQYAEKYPRSDVPRKQPLLFLAGAQFRTALDKYLRRALTKGIPPLFKELKVLYKSADKLQIVEELMLSYAQNLSTSGYVDDEQEKTWLWLRLW